MAPIQHNMNMCRMSVAPQVVAEQVVAEQVKVMKVIREVNWD